MKRRFVVTLLAVAIASFSASAFCRAPVIGEFQSPIISDDKPVTDSNVFVYPDVYNLDLKATDPDGSPAPGGLTWSFTGDGSYLINGRQPLNLANPSDDPNAPGTKEVGKVGLDDLEANQGQDSVARTVTFRNKNLSPIGGPNVNVAPGTRILTAETRVVTLFCSDGSTYTSKSFLVYTAKTDRDRLSGGVNIVSVVPSTVPSTAQGWSSFNVISGLTFSSTGGLCAQGSLTPGGFGGWVSPYGILPLVSNNVYRIRVNVSTGTAPAIATNVTPLWDFVLDNFSGVASSKDQRYSCDWLFWDNNGSANSAGLATPAGRHTFDCWWAPMPVLLSDWSDAANTTGPFNVAQAAVKDGRLQFRMLDVDNSAVDGQNDAGTLCVTSYQIDRIAQDSLAVTGSPLLNQTTFSASTNTVSMLNISANPSTVLTFPGGAADIAPANATAWGSVEVANFDLGDNNVNYGTPSTLSDNWPIPWVSNQLLRYKIGVQAPSAAGQSNPPDAIHMMMDTASTEVLADNMVLFTTSLVGGPKSATVNDYMMLYYTHNKTLSAVPQYGFLRTRFGIICRSDLQTGSPPSPNNPNGVRITYERLDQIDASSF